MFRRALKDLRSGKTEVAFFAAVNLSSLFMVVFPAVCTYFDTRDPSFLTFMLLFGSVLLLVLWRTVRTEKYALGQLLTVIADACILLPFSASRSDGFSSSISVTMVLLTAAAAACTVRKYRRIAIGVLLAAEAVCLLLEARFPELADRMSETHSSRNIFLCLSFISAFLYLAMGKLVTDYTVLLSARTKTLEEKDRMYQDLIESEAGKNSFLYRFRHDAHHHNHVLLELLENGHTDEAISYLKAYDSREIAGPGKTFCVNLVLNSILNYTDRLCGKNGISLSVSADVAEHIPVDPDDLCAITANLLENAVSGALESGAEEAGISFRAVTKGNRLTFVCENTCRPELRVKNGMPAGASTGIRSICSALKKYDGTMVYEKTEKQCLRCAVLLNLEYSVTVKQELSLHDGFTC